MPYGDLREFLFSSKEQREGTMRVYVLWISFFLFVGLVSPVSAQLKGWEKEWNEILSAAKKEGRVVVMGSADPVVRRELPARFYKRFGIVLEYLGGRGSANSARLLIERRVGVHTVDAIFSGLSSQAVLYQEKALDPIKPVLILPEVVDPSKWKQGKIWFLDPEEKYVLRLYNYLTTGGLSINTKHVKREEFQTVKDLLNPKWKGKISVRDPRRRGSGSVEATRFYRQFGEEFMKRLYVDQEPGISGERRQIADWLARGSYPVSFAVAIEDTMNMKKDGLPVDVIPVPDMPSTLTAGNGLLGLLNSAPHPNAARVFVNWMASREGLEVLGRARYKPTTRNDIDESYAEDWVRPKPGVDYFDAYQWNFFLVDVPKVRAFMRELLRSR